MKDYDPLTLYISHLSAHSSYLSSPDLYSPELVSSNRWSSSEKSTFFHSIARHSRLRPDLISLDIGSKNILEVQEYINILEDGKREVQRDGEGGGARWVTRGWMEGAREVSEDWVQFEEYLAASVISNEAVWIGERKEKERVQEWRDVVDVGTSTRRRKRMQHYQPDPSNEELTELQNKWTKEDLLSALDVDTLTVLRSIFEEMDDPASLLPSIVDDEETHDDLQGLAPAERRKIRNRLRMRAKRAAATGSNTGPTLLPRGIKPRATASDAVPSISTSVALPDATTSTSTPVQVEISSTSPIQAQTKPRKRKRTDAKSNNSRTLKATVKDPALGINWERMKVDDGFELVNLGNIGNVIEMYNSLLSSSEASHQVANVQTSKPSIQYSSFKLLKAYLLSFLLPLLHRSIVLAEEERGAKSDAERWGGCYDSVKGAHVKAALNLAGIEEDDMNVKAFFEELEERLGVDIVDSDKEEAEDEAENPDHEPSEIKPYFPPSEPLLPIAQNPEDDSLLSVELTRLEARNYEAELIEDAHLEERDEELDEEYETELWAEFGCPEEEPAEKQSRLGEEGWGARKRKRVMSRRFISDSSEEEEDVGDVEPEAKGALDRLENAKMDVGVDVKQEVFDEGVEDPDAEVGVDELDDEVDELDDESEEAEDELLEEDDEEGDDISLGSADTDGDD